MDGVCNFINSKVSEFVKGKELPLSKAQILAISGWVQRQKQKQQSEQTLPMNYSSFGVKAVFEALQASYGRIMNQEAPAIASFEHHSMKTVGVDSNPVPPRLMFSLFNGGKALGSKVKFAKFYLIMQHDLEDV